jgi:two-component system, OmpR family, response regulator
MVQERSKPYSFNQPKPETTTKVRHSKAIVLVVDDDIRILRFIRESLKLADYEVITASDGEEAMALMNSTKPDIIVLDIVMSPMDGFEFLKKLRKTAKLPVIMMSVYLSAAQEAIALGADFFLNKPFNPDQLSREIKSLLDPPR